MKPSGRSTEVQEIIYPESDGQPMADNTLQFRWIATLEGRPRRLYVPRTPKLLRSDRIWFMLPLG